MTFTNTAAITYGGNTINSNTVSGEVVPALIVTKNASVPYYTENSVFEYEVTVGNITDTDYTGLSLLDNLGRYLFNGFSRFPLSFVNGSQALVYYSGGIAVTGGVTAIETADGILFTFDLPARTVAVISYNVLPTVFAPLTAGALIVNTATVSGGNLSSDIIAKNTLSVLESPKLTVSKCADGNTAVGEQYTFKFIVSNYGNTATSVSDYIVVSDTLNPPLENISVYGNGTLWSNGVEYDYSEALYYFRTQPGAVTLPAASYTVDSFGRTVVSPSSFTIEITGTVAETPPSQSVMEVLPAYTDGKEEKLTVTKVQNDLYSLGRTDIGVAPAYSFISHPESTMTLLPASDMHFSFSNNTLTVDTAGVTGTVSAFIFVNYGGGFTVRADYA